MLCAAERLAESGEQRVDLLFVVGEEKGSDGARAANHLPATSKFLVNGEPTESKLASGAKGSQRVIVRTRGRAAHSAYPQLGVSAIEPMLALLPNVQALPLPTDPVLGETTVNIGTIHGGTEANIIPALCEVRAHVSPRERRRTAARSIVKWADGKGRARMGLAHSDTALSHDRRLRGRSRCVHVRHPAAQPLGHAAALRPRLHSRRAHDRTKFIDVDELRAAVDAYERIARTVLAS